MINIKNIRNQKVNLALLAQTSFYSFPIWFIIGSFAVNLNLLFFIIISLILINKEQLKIRLDGSIWILFVFFVYLFVLTIIQFQFPGPLHDKIQHWSFEEQPIFKSILLFRYVLLILLVDILFFNKILNLKKFFFSSFICTSFVSFDVILQYISGFDLLGYESSGHRNPGPFRDEAISGSYLMKFSFFSFFYFLDAFKNNNKNKFLLTLLITFHMLAIFVSGNRIPMLLFLFGSGLIILFIKNIRLPMILGLITSVLIIFIYYQYYSKHNHYGAQNKIFIAYKSLGHNINRITKNLTSYKPQSKSVIKENYDSEVILDLTKKKLLNFSNHVPTFLTAIEMWQDRPWTGYGLKSFRVVCHEILDRDYERTFNPEVEAIYKVFPEKGTTLIYVMRNCSNHPHHYYLELLSETGIVGTFLIIILFFIVLKNALSHLIKNFRNENSFINLLIPLIIVLIIEIWPIRTSGSFFTTTNATFIWLIVGILFSNNLQNRNNNL